ncbi:MAG TPA: transcription termination/antitermination protein NusG, partial [Terrimesophilobacter sp.]|nr:transcription termination/antitermination protein NusG [Terrimesophilobacter sp.]
MSEKELEDVDLVTGEVTDVSVEAVSDAVETEQEASAPADGAALADHAAVQSAAEPTDAAVSVDTADADADAEAEAEEEVDPYAEFRAELKAKPGKWYVIHSYAGFEKRVKSNIENRRV